MKNTKIKKALISVSNKENLEKILPILKKFKIKIISSGGSYKKIKNLKYKCTELSKYTGFSEILNGRVKTLHPKIYAGILSIRKNKKHPRDKKSKGGLIAAVKKLNKKYGKGTIKPALWGYNNSTAPKKKKRK